jgi:hypothetical protein
MPNFRKRKSPRKARKARRARSSRIVNLGRSPVAKSALVSFRYCETVTVAPAAGLTASYIFRANSLNDPNYTGVGHQPLGFDQWSVFYDNYCVLGSKLTVIPVNTSTTIPLVFGIVSRQGGITSAVDPNLLKEQGDSHWAYAGNMNNMKQRAVTKKMSIAKFTGFPKPQNESSLKASMASDPDNVVWYQVWAAAADSAADPATISFNITLDYIAMLSKPKKLAQS